MLRLSLVCLTGIYVLGDVAVAQTVNDETLNYMAKRVGTLAPEPGRDRAPVKPLSWCDGVVVADSYPDSVVAAYEGWKSNGFNSLILAAQQLCGFAEAPQARPAAATIEQAWINLTGLSEADAVESIRARVHTVTWKADHDKLCAALDAPGESIGEDRAFMATRRVLFGCPGKAQWGERPGNLPSDLLAFMEQSDVPADELIRLSRILERTSEDFNSTNAAHLLAQYVIDGHDFRALSSANAQKALQSAPYAGNLYARVIVKESLARARLRIAVYEKQVQERVSDPDWKELLVTAPQRGIESYTASATTHQAEIARSNAFERKALGPSKRAAAGCQDTLRKDFVGVYRTLPHATFAQAVESLSDPVASLLFRRLLVCMGLDGEAMLASEIKQQVLREVRTARGVRTAAYYAALEALGKISADRERFPLKPDDLAAKLADMDVLAPVLPHEGTKFESDGTGQVKAVKKVANGLQVTFVTTKHQEMSRSCVNTNRIVQIRSDGTIQYYQQCRDLGLITVDDTPAPVVVPTAVADGIAAGAVMDYRVTYGQRIALPKVVFSDKQKKKVTNLFGLGL